MAAKLTGLTQKIAIQLHLVAESCTIRSSRSRAASLETFEYTVVSYMFTAFFIFAKQSLSSRGDVTGYQLHGVTTQKNSTWIFIAVKTSNLDDFQGKGKVVLCLTKHHAMKTYGEWRYSATHSWPRL
jgi:hypothetical protein